MAACGWPGQARPLEAGRVWGAQLCGCLRGRHAQVTPGCRVESPSPAATWLALFPASPHMHQGGKEADFSWVFAELFRAHGTIRGYHSESPLCGLAGAGEDGTMRGAWHPAWQGLTSHSGQAASTPESGGGGCRAGGPKSPRAAGTVCFFSFRGEGLTVSPRLAPNSGAHVILLPRLLESLGLRRAPCSGSGCAEARPPSELEEEGSWTPERPRTRTASARTDGQAPSSKWRGKGGVSCLSV